jgi:hypothetical protein
MRVALRAQTSLVLTLAVLAATGCSTTEPDVVARNELPKDKPDAYFPTPDSACLPGTYQGDFYTSPNVDGGVYPVVSLAGAISFTLQGVMNGEFLILSGAKLEGSSGSATFTATVTGSYGCGEGAFSARIEDGEYDAGAGAPVAFHGRCDGSYYAGGETPGLGKLLPFFAGTWSSWLGPDPPADSGAASAKPFLTGLWMAQYRQ